MIVLSRDHDGRGQETELRDGTGWTESHSKSGRTLEERSWEVVGGLYPQGRLLGPRERTPKRIPLWRSQTSTTPTPDRTQGAA